MWGGPSFADVLRKGASAFQLPVKGSTYTEVLPKNPSPFPLNLEFALQFVPKKCPGRCSMIANCSKCLKWTKCSRCLKCTSCMKFHFMKLPAEIKNQIYDEILAPTGYVLFKRVPKVGNDRAVHLPIATGHSRLEKDSRSTINLNFLGVSKQIYEECKHIFTEKNTFIAHLNEKDWLASPQALTIKYLNLVVDGSKHEDSAATTSISKDYLSASAKNYAKIEECATFGALESLTLDYIVTFDFRAVEAGYLKEKLLGYIGEDQSIVDWYLSNPKHDIRVLPFFRKARLDRFKSIQNKKFIHNDIWWDEDQENNVDSDTVIKNHETNYGPAIRSLFKNNWECVSECTEEYMTAEELVESRRERVPRLIYGVISDAFGGEVWHNGRLIWKDNKLVAEDYKRKTPYTSKSLEEGLKSIAS